MQQNYNINNIMRKCYHMGQSSDQPYSKNNRHGGERKVGAYQKTKYMVNSRFKN